MKSEKTVSFRILRILLLVVAFLSEKPLHAEKPLKAPDDLLLATMEKELHRGQSELAKQDPAPYFARYNVTDGESLVIVTAHAIFRVMIEAETRADDGMQLMRVETFQFSDPAKFPSDAEVAAAAKKMASDLSALHAAPLAQPYSGPALLSGRAAAVFFHEVLGHRIEGQRQRGRDEGQTFTKKVNEKILPEFLSVTDDPTLHTLAGTELSGFYRYDDEGTPASRVEVVKDGVLKNFLMGRLPVKSFSNSNGHGRAQSGLMPVGRQGNLVVTSSKTIPDAQLRSRFIEEIKKQGKPYGLFFEDIQG